MKALNKFLCILTLLILSSCEKTVLVKEESIICIENKLDKELYFSTSTNIGDKGIYINHYKQDSLTFYVEKLVETNPYIQNEIESHFMINILDFKIYNLTDTTNSIWSELYDNETSRNIFSSHLEIGNRKCISEFNHIDRHIFTIDSTLLPIFKKDYGMLEQFKEYYE